MTRKQYLDNLFKTYQLVRVLADKNGSQTLRVRHRTLKRDMVVRSLPKSFEAYALLCNLRCEHLPVIFDTVLLEDGQIVLEEFIDGMTVHDVMETGRYHYRGAKVVLSAVCDGLSVLHEANLVHRDIKPENIMIDKNGRVVLIDFNASRVIKHYGTDTVVMGTVGYASPEQLGVAQSDARTDIYALGVLLNVMLTGKHPSETIADGRAGRIIKKCTNINPNDRFSSVTDFKNSL